MTKAYDEKHIRVLTEVEQIRTNPGMWIGETSNPVHLIEEALDNSLDECLAGSAKSITVNIDTKKHEYSVVDDGRGIPIYNDVPVTISTKLFSGAKFQDSKSAYTICSGLHGVGLVAVNALSEEYIIEIYRDKKFAIFKFKNSKLVDKSIKDFKDNVPFSTKIQFKPDKKTFESMVPDVDRIRRRLLVASVELQDCFFTLNVDGKKEEIKLTPETFFQQYCKSDNDSEVSPLIEITVKDDVESMTIRFAHAISGSLSPRILSSVNLLPVDSGGTHVNFLQEIIRDFFGSKGKKANMKFQPNDALIGLRAYITLELKTPEFAGQTKDKLINRRTYLEKLFEKFRTAVEKYYVDHLDELEKLLAQFEDYRSRLDLKKINKTGGNGKRTTTKYTKLRDCRSSDGELFIVEGDSAEGSLIQCRDPEKHAVLPLRGKIPSVMNVKDILENNEIREIISALGIGVYPNITIENLRYDKIIILTDADADGEHIASILIMDLAVLVPDLIKSGKLYLAKTPLYSINDVKKKLFIPLWTDDELKKAVAQNKPILRAKGLGELNPEQLEQCALNPKLRKLTKITYTSNLDKLTKLFSDVTTKRELLEGKFNI